MYLVLLFRYTYIRIVDKKEAGTRAIKDVPGRRVMASDISRGGGQLIREWYRGRLSDCRPLKAINPRRGRRKEFAIWYGNRELGTGNLAPAGFQVALP